MANSTDVTVKDIYEKVEALSGAPLNDQQRAQTKQLIEDTVDERVATRLEALKTRPAGTSGSELDGTQYGRMGISPIDVQILHGILVDGRRRGISENGPSETLSNLVTAIQKRVVDEEGLNLRAMDTADTTALIGAQYTTTVWKAAAEQAVVLPLLRSYPMTQKTDYIPVFGAPPRPVAYPESVADDSADYETQDTPFARVTTTAHKFGVHQKWSGELEEESLIPFIAAIREQQQNGMAIYGDEAVVSGDDTIAATGNINSDDAQMAANDLLTQFDGIRHGALVDNTANVTNAGASLTYAHLSGLRVLCVDRTRKHNWGYPANPSDFVYLTSPEGADKIANLDEVITLDKFGQNATVLTGQVAKIGMNPILVTMAVPRTEADGKLSATPASNTLDQVVAFNRNAVAVGYLRQVTVETYRETKKDQNGIVLFWRMGLARYTPTGAASGIEWVAVIRNI